MEKVQFKKIISQFVEITDAEWEVFSSYLTKVVLKKGDYFFKHGDTHLSLGVVIEGLLHSHYISLAGKMHTKTFVWENRFAGAWTAIVNNDPALFSCEALEDSVLLTIRGDKFLELMDKYKNIGKLAQIYTQRLLKEREFREYSSLALTSTEQYELFKQTFPKIRGRVPQYLIASYIGISEVSLSRLKKI